MHLGVAPSYCAEGLLLSVTRSGKMVQLFKKARQAIGRRFNRAARRATKQINSGVGEIVNQTLANEEVEELVAQAVERVIVSLIQRYWLALVASVLVLLGVQSVFLSIALTVLLRSLRAKVNSC